LTAVNVGWIVMAVMIGLAVLISFVVSYWVWRNDPERETFSVDDEQKPSSGHSGPKA
jgi:regulatory protein YycH of two-component signal transduction system YycFG